MGGAAEAKKGIFHRFAVDLSPIGRSAPNHDVGPDKDLAMSVGMRVTIGVGGSG